MRLLPLGVGSPSPTSCLSRVVIRSGRRLVRLSSPHQSVHKHSRQALAHGIAAAARRFMSCRRWQRRRRLHGRLRRILGL
jgi:hypothetical protein